MSRRMPGLTKKTLGDGRVEWYIDKVIKGYGRVCESTQTGEIEEAEAILLKRIKDCRDALVHGVRPKRTFREAATRWLNENAHRRGVSRDADALKDMDEFIGGLPIDGMHNGSFDGYRNARRNPKAPRPGRKRIKPLSNRTLNRHIGVAARVLEDAATKWRDDVTNLTWLAQAPWIQTNAPHKDREPYPLDSKEQELLFSELAPHLLTMAKFDVETGARDEELCALEWAWEIPIPELPYRGRPRSVFLVPEHVTKTRTDNPRPKLLVLNDAAQDILESVRGQHKRYVFVYEDHEGRRDRMYTMRSTGWLAARRRASKRYFETLGSQAPFGFRNLRPQDLRHTFGRRLRAAGVGFEDRQDLLGHKSDRVTTHYSAPEVGNLVEAANLATQSRRSPARTLLRVVSSAA